MNVKVFQRVVSSVAEALNVEEVEVTADKTFQDLGADSLDGVNAIMEIEKEFDSVLERLYTSDTSVENISSQMMQSSSI